jgi:hypothetical protein
MMHLTEGVLQAYLDDELAGAERVEVEAHVAACSACSVELAELERASSVLAAALGSLPEPGVVLLETRAGVARRSREAVARPAAGFGWALGRAALLVLGLAAAASAAIPGSPVRRWIVEFFEAPPTLPPAVEPVVVEPPAAEPPPPAPRVAAEVSVAPAEGEVRVVLGELSRESHVRLRLTDEERASVLAYGAAGAARFTTGPGRIDVRGPVAADGELLVLLPRGAARAALVVNGRTYLEKVDEAVRLLVPATGSIESELLFRVDF